MTADLIGMLVDKGIMLFAGIYFTLLGYRIVGKRPGVDEKYDAKMNKVSKIFKICGPVLVVIALLLIASKFLVH